MDREKICEVASAIAKQIRSSEGVHDKWAPWTLAEQINRLIDLVASDIGAEIRGLLPPKFERSALRSYATARYIDVAIAAEQIAALAVQETHKENA